ncbi:tolloid-like protein 1 isoform X2 [Ornithodoros turicata]
MAILISLLVLFTVVISFVGFYALQPEPLYLSTDVNQSEPYTREELSNLGTNAGSDRTSATSGAVFFTTWLVTILPAERDVNEKATVSSGLETLGNTNSTAHAATHKWTTDVDVTTTETNVATDTTRTATTTPTSTTPTSTTRTTTTPITVTATNESSPDWNMETTRMPRPFSAPCNVTFTGISGEVMSLNYPLPYPGHLNQTWCIRTPHNCQVLFTFVDLVQDNSTRCNVDNIAIYDGGSPSDEKIGLSCSALTKQDIISTDSVVRLWFTYDHTRQLKAFKAHFTAVNCSRGRRLEAVAQTARSLSFRSQDGLNNSTDRIWTLESQNGHVQLTFVALEMSDCCECEFLEVFDGSERRTAHLMGKYCGKKVPPVMVSTTKTFLLHYYNNGKLSSKGFRAKYRAIS